MSTATKPISTAQTMLGIDPSLVNILSKTGAEVLLDNPQVLWDTQGVKFTNHSEGGAGMSHYRGVTYFKSYQDARAISASIPGSRIVSYLRGFAVQLVVSGPYYFAG